VSNQLAAVPVGPGRAVAATEAMLVPSGPGCAVAATEAALVPAALTETLEDA
jgi:hypothetical protein